MNKAVLLLMIVLCAAPTSAFIDLISPEDNAFKNTANFSFDYYPELNNSIEECALEINGNILMVDANVSNSAPNSFIVTNTPQGVYDWQVHCSNAAESETSAERTVTMDLNPPAVTLSSPANGTMVSDADLTFKAVDNSSMACDLYIDGDLENSNISVQNNTQHTETVAGLPGGMHEWNVTCRDAANNTGKSRTRWFTSEAEFSIGLDKDAYDMGDEIILTINAPDGTNLSLDICPDGEGFVECYSPITMEEKDYPREETLPFTNKSGDYVIDAFFQFGSQTEIRQLEYSVTNNMNVNIDGIKDAKTGPAYTYTAEAQGGTGALSYEWTLHNGSKVQGITAEITFGSSGEYTEKVKVTDETGNTVADEITVTVSKAFEVTVTVKDKKDNSLLEGAIVELDEDSEETGAKGKVVFLARKGTLDISAFMTDYEFYESNLTVDEKEEVTISLAPKANKTSWLRLISPEDGAMIDPGSASLRFVLESASDAECFLHVRKFGNFQNEGTKAVINSNEQAFEFRVNNGTYGWKVSCEEDGKRTESGVWSFEVGVEEKEQEAQDLGFEREAMLNELSRIVEDYAKLGGKEKDAAEKLGYYGQAKDALRQVQRAARDLHDVDYRTDMSDSEKEAEKQSIIRKTQEMYEETVTNIEITDSKTFVNYPNQEQLEPLVKAYAEKEGFTGDTKSLGKAILDMQGLIVVSTRATIIELERVSGKRETVTAIIKEVKVEDVPNGAYLMEYIPKEVAESVEELRVGGDYDVIEEDPVLGFEMQDEIVYYIRKKADLEKVKGINTIMVREGMTGDLRKATGSATLLIPKVDVTSKGFLIFIIILLVAIYFLHDYNVFGKLLHMFNGKEVEKEVHYVKVLVNDSMDNLEAGDYDKASLIYREIKLTFDSMSAAAKTEVYENVMDLVNKLDIAYSRQLSDKIDEALEKKEFMLAQELYGKLQATYRKLGDDYKKEIYGKVMEIAGRMG